MTSFRDRIQSKKFRLYLAWPFALWAFLFLPTHPSLFRPALLWIALGEAMRIWASGSIVKSRVLSISGPYRYLRNPLYLGSFLVGVGFTFILWHPVVFALYVIFFWFFYLRTIRKEEKSLTENFGESYRVYCQHVPRLLPRLSPYRGETEEPFRWMRLYENGETITLRTILLILILLHFKSVWWERRLRGPSDIFFIILFVFVGFEIIREVLRRRYKDVSK